MEVNFGTKEENNKRRQEEFLKLSPAERVIAFFHMVEDSRLFNNQEYKHPNNSKGNFVITKDG